MRTRRLALSSAFLCLLVAGCDAAPDPPGQDGARAGSAPSIAAEAHPGTLGPRDRALATSVAQEHQAKVAGDFVGATAVVSEHPDGLNPVNLDDACAAAESYLVVRIVWDSANFGHSATIGGPPDGPRQAQIVTVLPGSGHLCEAGARYRDVGANANETLLYGSWPDLADG